MTTETKKARIEKWIKSKGYTGTVQPSEMCAIERAMLIESLGFPVTHETINRELTITRYRLAREAATA